MVYTYIRNEQGEFICPHCNIIKKNQNTMHYHLKKHEGDLPHECKHCKAKFLHLSILNIHLNAKHPNKDNPVVDLFTCPYEGCDYSSATKANRRIHYFRVHLKDIIGKLTDKKEDKFVCKCCNKEANSQTSLYYHIGMCVTLPDKDNRQENFTEIMA